MRQTETAPRRIAEYLGCDHGVIQQALLRQKELAGGGIRKRLGEILHEMEAVSRDDLIEAIHDQRLDRLRTSPVFAGLSEGELMAITSLVGETSVMAGEEFIRQDDIGDCFYVVIEGEGLVFRKDETGEEILLAKTGFGESIGEMGYFSDGRRSATIRAATEMQLLSMSYADLTRAIERAPGLARNLLMIVAKRLQRTNLRFQEVVEDTRKVKGYLHNLRSLVDMSEIMALSMGVEKLIERVVHTASSVMDAERASLFLVDRVSGEIWSKVAEGEKGQEIRVPIGKGVAGWVAQHGEFVNIPDAYEDSRFNNETDRRTGYRTRSILCGPVNNLHGETVGVVQVINKKQGVFDEEDDKLFRVFAYQTAISVENFRLYQKMMSSHEKMAVLLDVATSVAQTLDLDALIEKIVVKISEILGAERSSLFLLDQETEELWAKKAEGTDDSVIRFPTTEGLAGHVARTGEILNIADAYEDSRFNPSFDRETGFGTRTVLAVPVWGRNGAIIGVTQAMNKTGGPFDKEDEDLLKLLSSQIAVALENAQLYKGHCGDEELPRASQANDLQRHHHTEQQLFSRHG